MSANKMAYPEGTFLWWGLFIPGLKTIAYVVDKQSDICRRYLLLQGLYIPSLKTTAYVCNRFNTSFCLRDHKANQAISNLNEKFWNRSAQQIKSTISLTGLCFKKKFEQEKKSLYKISISKSICVDTYYVLFVIIVTEYDFVKQNFLPYITKWWWYCECKLFKSEKWCHLLNHDCLWQDPNPQCSKLFIFK